MVGITEIVNFLPCDEMSSTLTLNTYTKGFWRCVYLPWSYHVAVCTDAELPFCHNPNWNTLTMGLLSSFQKACFFLHLLIEIHSFLLPSLWPSPYLWVHSFKQPPYVRFFLWKSHKFVNMKITSSSKDFMLKLNSDKHGHLKYRLERKRGRIKGKFHLF